ncbi:hypothetical protein DFH08DRAFT_960905 [Mycena albidolilacea]|uniref:DUF6534 domain-containing protein n=1 Tax=Mycena albidolilacea TaxID=1033008 RepID=A0AAD7ER54_9AGAR|nr:hypothetical protein DFH08DRAFT_960905 [Mycena albidolilacea]
MSFNRDIILGALLVGTWGNSVLYTVEVIQACESKVHGGEILKDLQAAYYYRDFKQDNWMLKLLVFSTIAFDSVSMIANYASVYLYTITHWASAQSFLATRYWLLTKNKFTTFILFFFITVAAGGALASGATVAISPQYKDRRKVIIPATTWLLIEAVTDISIALALVLELRKMKSPIKKNRSLVNKLVSQTIQTGTAGATIALAVLIAYLANKESNVTTAIAYCIGRVYCITMLANLNNRKIGKTWSGTLKSSRMSPETRGERGNQERSNGGDEYSGKSQGPYVPLSDRKQTLEMGPRLPPHITGDWADAQTVRTSLSLPFLHPSSSWPPLPLFELFFTSLPPLLTCQRSHSLLARHLRLPSPPPSLLPPIFPSLPSPFSLTMLTTPIPVLAPAC